MISSDRPPKDIPQLEERLKSRFEDGFITDIQPPSLETKIIILRREAKKEKIEIPDEVMHLIASKVRSNIRELRGALTKIVAYSKLINTEITDELAKDVLKDFIGEKPHAAAPPPEPVAASADAGQEATGGKPRSVSQGLSSIEKRLSSLRKKLSPIIKSKKVDKEPVKDSGPAPKPEKVAEAGPDPEKDGAAPESPPTAADGKGEPTPKESAPPQPVQEGPSAQPEVPVEVEAVEGGSEAEEEVELAKCGNCGELVPGTAIVCPNCGVSFANETFECPVCHGSVDGNANRCDNCGAEFEVVDEEELQREEEEKKKKKKKK